MADAYKCGTCESLIFLVLTGPRTEADPGVLVTCQKCERAENANTLAEAFARIERPEVNL